MSVRDFAGFYDGGIVRLVYRYGAREGETGRYWAGALGLPKLLVWHDGGEFVLSN